MFQRPPSLATLNARAAPVSSVGLLTTPLSLLIALPFWSTPDAETLLWLVGIFGHQGCRKAIRYAHTGREVHHGLHTRADGCTEGCFFSYSLMQSPGKSSEHATVGGSRLLINVE